MPCNTMKILVLATDIPATSKMPGSPRLFNLCRELSRCHELFFLTYHSSQERYHDFLSDPTTSHVFRKIEVLPDPPAVRWWGQQWHRAHLAAHFETRYRHPGYHQSICERIREVCSREHIDVIHADLLPMIQYVNPKWNLPAIVDLHDSTTLLCRRMLNAERGWYKRLSSYLGVLRARWLEGRLEKTADLIITNSIVDEQVIKEVSTRANTLTITNGVDMEYFTPNSSQLEPDKIVFTGVMGYAPNDDAASYFAEEIFPLVKAKRPQAQFWIVGSEPSERVKALTGIPGIHVTGKVDDVRPYVWSAAVFVCPLRYGSGVKNKILAAMAMEKATVATPLSIDGLDVADDRELLLAGDPHTFADKVVRLLLDEQEVRRLGTNGLACVSRRYSWGAMGKALDEAIQSVAKASALRRSKQRSNLTT
ncbi:MAG: glycosyltransferase [Nitrospira sp.]